MELPVSNNFKASILQWLHTEELIIRKPFKQGDEYSKKNLLSTGESTPLSTSSTTRLLEAINIESLLRRWIDSVTPLIPVDDLRRHEASAAWERLVLELLLRRRPFWIIYNYDF